MLRDRSGMNMAEYAIIGVLILIVAVAAFSALGGRISDAVNDIANSF